MLNYEIDGSMAIITGCTRDEDIISIPQTIDGHVVCRISDNAFSGMNNIKSITIPGSVKQIGAYAFSSCKGLSRVVIAEGCEVIMDWCFISCPIKELNLPHSLKEIGKHCFLGTSFKDEVEILRKEKEKTRGISSRLNSKACVLPLAFNDNLGLINHDFISTRAKYTNEQFIAYSKGNIGPMDMDIPLIFDGEQFMLALYTKEDIEVLEFKLSADIERELGKTSPDDPDFLVLAVDIIGDGKEIGSFIIKTPFLFSLSFKTLKIASKKAREFRYYCITLEATMKCLGNGNVDRIFALNQFEELIMKYKASFNNKVISKERLNSYIKRIDSTKLRLLGDFFKEVKGSPLLTYAIKIFYGVLNDSDLANKRIRDYAEDKLKLYYNELSSFDSFQDMCFNLDDSLGEIVEELAINLEDLAKRYSIELTDPMGNLITVRQAKSYKRDFIDNDDNYRLHAKYLILAYKEMQKINNDFIIDKYLNKE